MGENVVKQQHYVPQFYLREFATADEQIWVYDKIADRAFRTAIKNIAGETYFYDSDEIDQKLGEKQAVEKYLSGMESEVSERIARLLHRLRTNGFIRLHPEIRAAISLFSAFQILRTKEHRIMAQQMSEQMRKFLSKHPGSEKMIAEIDESMTEEAQKAFHGQLLFNIPHILEIADILKGHIWIITKRHSSHSFYTSDEPITKKENVRVPFRSNSGIACKGIEIHVPLSHDYAISLYERTVFSKVAHLDGQVIPLRSEENMIYQRQFSVRYSSRFVFCKDDDFEFARRMCAEDPQWRDPNRKRVTSNHDDAS